MSGHLWVAGADSPAARWTRAGRVAAAATLILGDALQLISHLSQPTLPDIDDALAWGAANPDLANLTKLLDVLATPFLFGSALVYVLLSRRSSPRLAYTGGVLLGCGLVGLSAVEGYETLLVALVGDGRTNLDVLAEVADQSVAPAGILMLLLLILGGLLGTFTLAAALWRSSAIPQLAAALVAVPLLVDVVFTESLGMGPHWISHVISTFTSCWIAWVILSAGSSVASSHRSQTMLT